MSMTTAELPASSLGSNPSRSSLERERRRLPLVEHYLQEQGRLTAVERFSQLHETTDLPAQSKYYRSLLPVSKPKSGQQYAFSVDLDRCSGCKACVTACHSL